MIFLRRLAHVVSILVLLAGAALASQPPVPRLAVKRQPPEQPPAQTQQQSAPDIRGTNESPVTVKVLPTAKTPQEAADEKQTRDDQSAANWWLVRLTAALGAIGLLQLVVFGLQARRLRQTIDIMKVIDAGQTAKMEASIAQATRSAAAMESVGKTLIESTAAVQTSLGISREISDTNKRIADTNANALHAAERAKLDCVHIQLIGTISAGTFPEVAIQFLNSGRTPARILEQFSVVWTDTPLPQERDDDEWKTCSGVVAPGRTITITRTDKSSDVLTAANWDAITKGNFTFAVYGAVRYDAGFDIIGEVGFGYRFAQNLTTLPFNQRFGAIQTPGYNYSN